MTRITVSLGEHDAALLAARAVNEARSVSQMARVLIERGLSASEGEEAAAPAVVAAPPPDTPETVAVKAKQAKAVMDKAAEALLPPKPAADAAVPAEPDRAGDPPAPATEKATPRPSPPSVPKKSIDEVLGDAKHKPKGTVSGRQAVLAQEAARRAAEAQDSFSLVCPNRLEHVVGVRCPMCKGIR